MDRVLDRIWGVTEDFELWRSFKQDLGSYGGFRIVENVQKDLGSSGGFRVIEKCWQGCWESLRISSYGKGLERMRGVAEDFELWKAFLRDLGVTEDFELWKGVLRGVATYGRFRAMERL